MTPSIRALTSSFEILWLRNDLRFLDHRVWAQWHSRLRAGESFQVACVWLESRSTERAGSKRRGMIDGALNEIQRRLRTFGGELWTSHQPADLAFLKLKQTHPNLSRVWVTHEPATEEQIEVSKVSKQLCGFGVEVSEVKQGTLLEADLLPFSVSITPEVFTEFRKQVEKHLKLNPDLIREAHSWKDAFLQEFQFLTLSPESGIQVWEPSQLESKPHPQISPGESAGLARLQNYIWSQDRLKVYKETRNGMLDWDDSSKLSPWFATGSLSPRVVFQEIRRYETERVQNESTHWLFFELLWRDYFRFICEKKGARFFGAMPEPSAELAQLNRWKEGQTGEPFIDANMRELAQTGWMSNRGRQNVASYLSKPLGIDWHLGAAYFEQQLLDYDVYSNWGNWAYVAGAGQDPRDRVFNPERQASMYDPLGEYQSRWLGPKRG